MVEKTVRSALKAEHSLEQMIESSTGTPTDSTEKELHELRRISEQTALTAFKATENWGKQALSKVKEITEEISL